MTISAAIDEMKKHSFDQFPVRGSDGNILGMATTSNVTTKLIKNKVSMKDKISTCCLKDYRNVSNKVPLHELGRIFKTHTFVFVDEKYIFSHIDLLKFIQSK